MAMIIGFDGSRAFIEKRTGTENYSFQLLKALAKIDRVNQYIVYLRPLRTQGPTLRSWPANFTFKEINWPRLWTQAGLAIQTFRDKLDVLFVPAHTLPIIRKPGLKTVVSVHDLGSEYLPSMHQFKQRLYLSFMQRIQLKGATKIIAVSKATKKDLVDRMGIKPDKIEAIYEGYDKKLFKPVTTDILRNTLKYFDIEFGKYFLFVGTVQPRKNLKRLIKTFKIFLSLRAMYQSGTWRGNLKTRLLRRYAPRNDDGIKLVIVGSKGWLSDEIYELPKKLGIEDKVKFLGYVPEKNLPALYSGAIALVFPSLFEGFGLPILEAQACGCPVVTSNISSMPEVAGVGAVYVNPYSTQDIIRGMREIGEIREKLIKAGSENIKRFSWEKCAAQTLTLFKNLKF